MGESQLKNLKWLDSEGEDGVLLHPHFQRAGSDEANTDGELNT